MGGAEQLVVVDAAVDEADPLGLGAVEHLAEHDGRHRRLRAGDAPEHPRVAAAGVQADLQEAGVEPGPPGGEAHVAAKARFIPAPTAAPLTAASVGSGLRAMRRNPS